MSSRLSGFQYSESLLWRSKCKVNLKLQKNTPLCNSLTESGALVGSAALDAFHCNWFHYYDIVACNWFHFSDIVAEVTSIMHRRFALILVQPGKLLTAAKTNSTFSSLARTWRPLRSCHLTHLSTQGVFGLFQLRSIRHKLFIKTGCASLALVGRTSSGAMYIFGSSGHICTMLPRSWHWVRAGTSSKHCLNAEVDLENSIKCITWPDPASVSAVCRTSSVMSVTMLLHMDQVSILSNVGETNDLN